jgi:hypothetical protein
MHEVLSRSHCGAVVVELMATRAAATPNPMKWLTFGV